MRFDYNIQPVMFDRRVVWRLARLTGPGPDIGRPYRLRLIAGQWTWEVYVSGVWRQSIYGAGLGW